MSDQRIDATLAFYSENRNRLEQFQAGVETFFTKNPAFHSKPLPLIHSTKTRLKSLDGLRSKILRKAEKDIAISKENLFAEITDLIGFRVLHLYQDQFPRIHAQILNHINEGDWKLVENPKSYTWDPESKSMYDNLQIASEIRETFYTSVHYVVAPNNSNPNLVCCEIQVRTLFEEVWGEIDHAVNYPVPTEVLACKEQLRVLSKLVSTGTRLADSIFRTLHDHDHKILLTAHNNAQ